jgi:hypothetical protein
LSYGEDKQSIGEVPDSNKTYPVPPETFTRHLIGPHFAPWDDGYQGGCSPVARGNGGVVEWASGDFVSKVGIRRQVEIPRGPAIDVQGASFQ